MIPISCVITAPDGISKCLQDKEFLERADGHTFEIIVVDGAQTYSDCSRPGLRHIWARGGSIYRLMTEGLQHARLDWVLLIEDHGRPMPGLLEAYHEAVLNNPDVDLFGGALENITSTQPWSFAMFLYGNHEYWPGARQQARSPSNANLLVRRRALKAVELASDTGFMFATAPRLMREGRHANCPRALLDHVLEVNMRQALEYQFYCSVRVTAGQRESKRPRSTMAQLLTDLAGAVWRSVVTPVRIASRVRGTPQHGCATLFRLILMGLSCGFGVFAADLVQLRTDERRRTILGINTGAHADSAEAPVLDGQQTVPARHTLGAY